MKKILCFLVSLILSLSVLAGCGGGGGSGSKANKITVWSVEGPVFPGYEGNVKDKDAVTTQFLVNKFHETYPDVKVVIEKKGWDIDLHTALRDAYTINKQPDIVVGEMFIKSQIELDYFIPLDIPKEYLDNVRPEFFEQSKGNDGKYYGIPMATNIPLLLYNETILREALGFAVGTESTYFTANGDFKVPSSAEGMKNIALTVKNYYVAKGDNTKGGFMVNNVSGASSGFRGQYMMSMYGGGWYDDAGELALSTQANKNAFTYYREIAKAAPFGNTGMTEENEIITMFLNGNVAMALEHPAMLADYAGSNIKSAPIPTVDGIESSNVLVGSVSYMVTKQSKNKDAAKHFVNLLLDKDVQTMIYTNSSFRLPVRRDVHLSLLSSTDDAVLARHKYLKPALETLVADTLVPGLPSFTESYTQIWEYWSSFNNAVLNSKTDIQALLNTLQTNVSSKLK